MADVLSVWLGRLRPDLQRSWLVGALLEEGISNYTEIVYSESARPSGLHTSAIIRFESQADASAVIAKLMGARIPAISHTEILANFARVSRSSYSWRADSSQPSSLKAVVVPLPRPLPRVVPPPERPQDPVPPWKETRPPSPVRPWKEPSVEAPTDYAELEGAVDNLLQDAKQLAGVDDFVARAKAHTAARIAAKKSSTCFSQICFMCLCIVLSCFTRPLSTSLRLVMNKL